MIVPDVNLVLYAYDSASAFHVKARRWWEELLSGTERVGLAEVVIFSFMRLGTSSRAFQHPLLPSEAAGHVRSWLAQPCVSLVTRDPDHVEQVLVLLEKLGAAGNLVTDAQLAALTIQNGAILHTADSDFVRFPTLRWFNPISGRGSDSVRHRKL